MVVGLDIDDTITLHPEFFAIISRALVAAGHRVVVITFRDDRVTTEADLRAWGIVYSELVLGTANEVLSAGVDEWKGAVCRRHGVEVFFEDDLDVLRHVDPSVACFAPRGWAAA